MEGVDKKGDEKLWIAYSLCSYICVFVKINWQTIHQRRVYMTCLSSYLQSTDPSPQPHLSKRGLFIAIFNVSSITNGYFYYKKVQHWWARLATPNVARIIHEFVLKRLRYISLIDTQKKKFSKENRHFWSCFSRRFSFRVAWLILLSKIVRCMHHMMTVKNGIKSNSNQGGMI